MQVVSDEEVSIYASFFKDVTALATRCALPSLTLVGIGHCQLNVNKITIQCRQTSSARTHLVGIADFVRNNIAHVYFSIGVTLPANLHWHFISSDFLFGSYMILN